MLVSERWCGNTSSSSPVRNTTGNSRPLAVCRVIIVTRPPWSSPSGISSASATRDTCSRNSASVPSSCEPSNSRATDTISFRFSTRLASCRSDEDSSDSVYPVRSSTASASSATGPVPPVP